MGLFKRAAVPDTDPAEVERYRGHANEIADVTAQPWQVVLASLELGDAGPGDPDDMYAIVMGPLGLRHDDDFSRGSYNRNATMGPWTSVYHGVRHGRPVLLNQGSQASGSKGAQVAWVGTATLSLSIVPDDGRLIAKGAAPEAVVALLAGVSPDGKLWKNMYLVGGDEGVVVKRPLTSTMHPQGWIYDLWLAERVADLVGTGALPEPDWRSSFLPYGLDKSRSK